MKMVKRVLLSCSIVALVTGCNKITYRKTPGGLPYKLFSGGDTQSIQNGNIIKLNFSQKINDSILFSNEGGSPIYIPVDDTRKRPYDLSEIWTILKVGDSLIATQMMDTFIKRNPMGVLPQFKKGDRIITTIKVLGKFTSNDSAIADDVREKQKWKDREIAFLQKYLDDKKIQCQKTPSGAFIQLLSPGTGNPIDSGKYVSVNYSGTSFSGVKFDSNTDTSFHHVGPYPFTVGAGQMIPGFDEAVKMMKMGSKARVYIPSSLGYAERPPTNKIKPYENLIFDIEVVDVKDHMPANTDIGANIKNPKPDSTQIKNKTGN